MNTDITLVLFRNRTTDTLTTIEPGKSYNLEVISLTLYNDGDLRLFGTVTNLPEQKEDNYAQSDMGTLIPASSE